MAYSGRYRVKNTSKYKGDVQNVIYRSLWEKHSFKWCDDNNKVKSWSSEEVVIPYMSPWDNRIHRYFPDFYMKVKQANGSVKKFIIEVKPKHQCKPPPKNPKRKTKQWFNSVRTWTINEAKWKSANEFCLDNGMEFKILTEDHLNPKYK